MVAMLYRLRARVDVRAIYLRDRLDGRMGSGQGGFRRVASSGQCEAIRPVTDPSAERCPEGT